MSSTNNSQDHQDNERSQTGSRTWIDPDSTEGAAIIGLLRQLKAIEHEDGSWPGSDVVDELNAWLAGIGLDPGQDPDDVQRRLRAQVHPWTVFGLRENDPDGDILIAGVVAGTLTCRDTDPADGDYQRVAESVLAADPHEAERRAYELFEAACDDE